MDAETLKRLGGQVRSISVTYSRKMWGDIGGSLGAEVGMEADVGAEADYQVLANALYEACREIASENMRPTLEQMQKPRDVPQPPDEGPQQAPPLPEPTRTPVDDSGTEYIRFDVDYFIVHEVNGKRSAKVYGGIYKKFGVTCWPEVMKTAGVDITICAPGNQYKFAEGVKVAVAPLNASGNPTKVTSFE